jgi:hypothetical protein
VHVLVACVAENQASWCTKVENLAISLREFGGRLSSAPMVASFVGQVQEPFARRLARFDVEVRTVARSDFGPPQTNKIAMLDLHASHDFDVLLALDCDVVVTGDVLDALDPDRVRATPEHASALGPSQWEILYRALGRSVPAGRIRMLHSGALSVPYYSSGVLCIPARDCRELREVWQRHCEVYVGLCRRSQLVSAPEAFADQVALSTALETLGTPVDALPPSLNLYTTVPLRSAVEAELHPPFILHYRSEIDANGFLHASRFNVANALIDQFNRARARSLGASYTRLTKAPRSRRLARWLAYSSWYSSGPMRAIRRSRLVSALKRRAKARTRGTTGRRGGS